MSCSEEINTIDEEGYRPFTKQTFNALHKRKAQLKRDKGTEKTSAAKQCIFKAINKFWIPPGVDDEELASVPDPSLEDGQELPQYYGKFPKEMNYQILEDIDLFYKQRGHETFCVVSRKFGKNYVYRFSATNGFFVFSPFLPLRQWAIRTILHPAFDAIVMAIILVNCVFLALDNEISNAEYVFTGLYTIEMVIKMLARGFILNPFTYLRDPWNWLDFVVVVLAYAAFFGTANVSSLRTFRVFRAFKSVSIVPGLKTIVNSLFHSMKPLAEVMLIMIFLLIVVALIALQAFMGVLKRRCVLVPPGGVDNITIQYAQNSSNWYSAEGEEVVCGTASGSGFCQTNYACIDDAGENPNFGYTSFDHMGFALLTSFQLLTLDRWENVYNLIIRAEGPWNILFFLMSVFLGPFYLLNLLLAVVTLAYSREHEKQEELELMRVQAKERTKRKNQRRKKLEAAKNMTLNAVSPSENENPSMLNIVSRITRQARENQEQSVTHHNEVVGSAKDDAVSANTRPPSSNNAREIEEADAKRNRFRTQHQNVSQDSGDSAKELKGLKLKWHRLKKWYMITFCGWYCSPCFLFFQRRLMKIINHKFFEILVMICIISNTIFLAIDYHLITPEVEEVLNIGNTVFTAIFTVEAILKILGMGPATYAKDLWNDFDFIIVFISLVELGLELSGGASGNTGLSVLRTLRLLRVFRLARMWGTMHKLMSIIWTSISAVGYLTIVLFLVLYIFAVIGKQLYGQAYLTSGDKFDDNTIPRWSFIDFYHSFLLVWRVMCGEWIEPLYDCLHIQDGDGLCIVYFLCILIIANFMVLNLFTAILLEAFSVDDLKGKQDKSEKENKKVEATKKAAEAFKRLGKKAHNEAVAAVGNNGVNGHNEACYGETSNSDNSARVIESHSTLGMFDLNKEVSQKAGSRSPMGSRNETSLDMTREAHSAEETFSELKRNSRTEPKLVEVVEDMQYNHMNEYFSTKPGGEVIFKNSNGSTNHERSSQASKKSKFRRGNLCCCCGLKGRETVPMNVTSDVVSMTTDDNDTVVSFVSLEEEKEKDDDDLPHCLPEKLRKRYPFLDRTPTCRPYKFWMCVRRACFCLVEHKFFEWFILFLILASTVCLAMEDKHLDSDPVRKHVLQKLEYVFTALFTLEMLLKWVGIGPTKYFTSVWCVLDCAIVAVSWAGIILQAASRSSQTGAFRSLRTLRALRPLRAVSRWQGMRVVVNALIYCIPSIGNVLCVCLLIWFVFSIMGVQFFKGQFFRCVDGTTDEELPWSTIKDRNECLINNHTWVNRNINFDNVIIGMVALFQVATFEGWIEVMADASDVRGVDNQPKRENSQYYMIFFVLFVLVGSFFILNLIVGVIIESFQTLRKGTQSSSAVEAFLTENQKKFYKTMKTMLNRKPKKTIPPPKTAAQKFVFNIVNHSRFELGIFILIVLNMLSLSMEHYQMTQDWTNALRVADIIFTSLFVLEALFKLFAMRFHYFKDVFNVFDFVVIIVSVTGFILENLVSILVSPTLLRVVRVFRIFRVLRVVRAARGIRRLIMTLMISIPALFNIAVLLGVFLVIFAILGMTSFMNVKLSGALNDQVNFQTFGNSLLVLFRLVTSAGWNDVLDPLMNTRDCNQSTDTVVGDCGDPVLAVLYFVLFIFIVFLVVVNMYIAIILENFAEIFQQDENGVSQGDFETFYMVWGRYDPKATQFVTLEELSDLLHELYPPFQLQKPNLVKIGALNLPVLHVDKVHCLDVLFALVRRIMGDVEISKDMKEEAEIRLLKSFPNRKSLKAETTTLLLRQQSRAAKVIQDAWKSFSMKRKRDLSDLEKSTSYDDILSTGINGITLHSQVASGSGVQSKSRLTPEITFVSPVDKEDTKETQFIEEPHASGIDGENIKQRKRNVTTRQVSFEESKQGLSPKKEHGQEVFSSSDPSSNNNNSTIKTVYKLLQKQQMDKVDTDIEEIPMTTINSAPEEAIDKEVTQLNKTQALKNRPNTGHKPSQSISTGAFVRPLSSGLKTQSDVFPGTSGVGDTQNVANLPAKPVSKDETLVHTKQLQNFVSTKPAPAVKPKPNETSS